MAWANIKSKRLQSVALVAVFISVSILFFLSIRLFGTTGDYAELFVESKASQSLIFVSTEETKDIIVDFLENQEEISNINTLVDYNNIIDANIMHEEEAIPIPDVFLTEYSTSEYDQIKIIEGKSASELQYNEVIFSYGKSQLSNVKIGDHLIINTENERRVLTIVGIGVDLTFNFDTITLNRFWTSLETIESLESEEREYSIGITYSDYSAAKEEEIFDALNVLLAEHASDTMILPHAIILSANSFFQIIMGAIFTLIGVILIVVGLFIIRSIIYNNILTESKKIATLKSTGFSSNNIVSMYLFEYGVLGFISIIIGIFGSIALGNVVLGDLTELSNLFGTSNSINVLQTIVAFIFILGVIELTVYLVAKGVAKVLPAVALSRGEQVNETKQVVSLTKYQNLPVSLVLAVKDIFYNKRMIITLVMFIIAMTFTIVSLSSASYSFNSQKENLQLWLGYDIDAKIVSEDPLDLTEHQELITKLEESEYVEGVVTKYIDMNSQIYNPIERKYITAISELFVTDDLDAIDFNVLSGRIPENESEVMLGHNMLVSLNKKIGDYVSVLSLGEIQELLVVGEYQGFTNQGMCFRMFLDDVPEVFVNNSLIEVNFVPDVEDDVLLAEIESLFHTDVIVQFEYANASLVSMLDILSIVTTGVIGIFAVICLIVLLNLNLTNVNKERFNYGIYKSIGMDDQTIINIYLLKNTIINIIGILIGGTLGILSLSSIVSAMTGSLGINEFPSSINNMSFVISIGIIFGVTIINSFVIRRNISSITPKELLVE
jgi:putative ABC transport system permease protein